MRKCNSKVKENVIRKGNNITYPKINKIKKVQCVFFFFFERRFKVFLVPIKSQSLISIFKMCI